MGNDSENRTKSERTISNSAPIARQEVIRALADGKPVGLRIARETRPGFGGCGGVRVVSVFVLRLGGTDHQIPKRIALMIEREFDLTPADERVVSSQEALEILAGGKPFGDDARGPNPRLGWGDPDAIEDGSPSQATMALHIGGPKNGF